MVENSRRAAAQISRGASPRRIVDRYTRLLTVATTHIISRHIQIDEGSILEVGLVTETEQFLAATSRRISEAEIALHNGDPGPRIAMWSRADPLTLFGAAMSGRGWGEIGPIFDVLGKQFSNCLSYENEIVAAEARGDLAYTVALERITASINDAETTPYVLRATTIFRRENGEWKVVHRHGDPLDAGSGSLGRQLTPPAGEPEG